MIPNSQSVSPVSVTGNSTAPETGLGYDYRNCRSWQWLPNKLWVPNGQTSCAVGRLSGSLKSQVRQSRYFGLGPLGPVRSSARFARPVGTHGIVEVKPSGDVTPWLNLRSVRVRALVRLPTKIVPCRPVPTEGGQPVRSLSITSRPMQNRPIWQSARLVKQDKKVSDSCRRELKYQIEVVLAAESSQASKTKRYAQPVELDRPSPLLKISAVPAVGAVTEDERAGNRQELFLSVNCPRGKCAKPRRRLVTAPQRLFVANFLGFQRVLRSDLEHQRLGKPNSIFSPWCCFATQRCCFAIPCLADRTKPYSFVERVRRRPVGTSEGPTTRFMVNSYKDASNPITDQALNKEVALRPLVGVSAPLESGRQLGNKADEQETRTIVITSGKGGVGKTTTTANLGMSIARLGYRVALIDADIGLRNLDLLLGLENRVLYTAMDIFEGDCRLDQALIRDKRLKNLCLLAISKNRQRYNVTRQKMDTLIASISALGYHFILIDCPAGIDIGFINAISPAQEALIVTTPEITAMRDADRVAGLLEANGIYNAKLLINRVRPDMIQRHDMMSVQDVQDVLGIPLLGAIPEDLNVIISTNRGEPLVLRKKLTLSGIAFENAARRLIGRSDYLIDLKTPYKGLFQKMKTLFFNNQ